MPLKIFETAAEFFAILPAYKRLLGLDFGTKTIGLATSDFTQTLASPAHTLKRKKLKEDLAALQEFVAKNEIAAIVIGLPRNMDGSEGPRAQSTRAFVRNISNAFELPLLFWDERLSTVAAERAMLEQDMSRAKRAEKIDAHAAAFILQGVLDAKDYYK
jgi:putative Holliday junction resolvase